MVMWSVSTWKPPIAAPFFVSKKNQGPMNGKKQQASNLLDFHDSDDDNW